MTLQEHKQALRRIASIPGMPGLCEQLALGERLFPEHHAQWRKRLDAQIAREAAERSIREKCESIVRQFARVV